MKTSYITLKTLAVILITALVFTACDAPNSSADRDDSSVNSMGDLRVPANFDWKTHKDFTINITGYENGRVRIISEDGAVYHQANVAANNQYSAKITVPAYRDHVIVVYRGQQKELNLNRSVISHSFGPK